MYEHWSLANKQSLFILCSSLYHSPHATQSPSPLCDRDFDALKREICEIDPTWAPLHQAGWKVNPMSPLQKGKHVGFMGSIYNAYDYAPAKVIESEKWRVGFQEWTLSTTAKIDEEDEADSFEVYAAPKIDGLSVGVEYNMGKLVVALTRGDCVEGENVTDHMVQLGVPAFIDDMSHFVVRGEVVFKTTEWQKYLITHPEAKNPRNAASGIMGRKEVQDAHCLNFIAHGITPIGTHRFGLADSFSGQLKHLESLDFEPVMGKLLTGRMACEQYFEKITAKRDELPFEIDGVVFRVNNIAAYDSLGVDSGRCPRGAVAWKFPSLQVTTKLISVHLTVGHTGVIAPTAGLTPVPIGGVTVSKASLANFEEIARLGIYINDTVVVSRQGDVIPKIMGLAPGGSAGQARERIYVPTSCPICQGKVGPKAKVGGEAGALLYCLNQDCPAKSTGKINKWINDTSMMGVGKAIVDAMVAANLIYDVADLYVLRQIELATMPFNEGEFGKKRAGNVVAAIQKKKTLPLNLFLGALGVPGLGEGVVRNVREKMPGEFDKLTDWVGCTKMIDFADRIGLPNTARGIYTSLSDRQPLVAKLLHVGVTIAQETAPAASQEAGGPLAGKVFCLTGSFPQKKSMIEAAIRSNGGSTEDDVRGNVTHVVMDVVPSDDALTGKGKKARAKGLPLMSLVELQAMFRPV